MKGIVFNQLQAFVEQNHGLIAWDQALQSCDLPSQGIYVATKSYDDQELSQLVGYFCQQLGVKPEVLKRAFGEFVFERLFQIAPQQAKEATSLRQFLLMVEDIIHVEVKKLYQDTNLPEINYQQCADTLVMIYRSPRKLCHLSEGLILGAAKHFDEVVDVKQSLCMHQGDEHCSIEITFL